VSPQPSALEAGPTWVPKVLLLGLGGLAVLYGIISLAWPLGWDQGIMAWVGSVVASGGLPFQDAWDPKGPAAYLPFAIAPAVGLQLPIAYRAIELLLLSGGAIATGSIVRTLGFPRAAQFAAVALVLTQPGLEFRHTLQPDQWAGWLLTGAVAITLGRLNRHWLGALAGALVGLAGLIKPQYGLAILIPLAGEWSGEKAGRWRRIWSILGGAAAPVLACLAWFGAGNGLDALVDGYVVANLEARFDRGGQIVPFGSALPIAAGAMPYLLPLALAAGFGLAACWKRNRRHAALLLGWFALIVVGMGVQGRWAPYLWTPAIPPFVVLGILGLAALGSPRQPAALRRLRLGLAVGLGLSATGLAIRPLFEESQAAAALALGRIDRLEYLSRFRGGGPRFSADEVARAAEYVTRMSAPGECVLVWPEPGVNVLARRCTPSRFATVAALTRYERSARRKRYQEEFLGSLRLQPPRLILIDSMATANRPEYLGDLVNRFPEFLRLVQQAYDLTGTVGKYTIWVPHHLASRRYP
jgi:hypothetical protein